MSVASVCNKSASVKSVIHNSHGRKMVDYELL